MKIYSLLFATIISAVFISCSTANKPALSETEKREWKHAVNNLTIQEELEVTLFAHEPMLVNPTNIDIDDKGRVWVCEGYNYRNELNPFNPDIPEGDRIIILEDTDGNGVADAHKVFYQGNDVNSALGIAVLGKWVFVSCSPYMFVFTDQDGDDLPDQKDTLFTAVGGVQHDHGLHAVSFGPDGKLYFNYGNNGTQLRSKDGNILKDRSGLEIKADGKPYHQGMVFRCNMDGSDIEVLGHNFRNNYEVAVDSYGTLWQSDNDDDGNRGVRINYVMEYGNYGYRDEMTGEGWRTRRTGMAEEIPIRHWHQHDPGVIPNLLQTGAGSPTGMIVYEGDLLPERYHNQMIHCDAGPRVVRSYPVETAGAGYSASQDTLIAGISDLWFRPSDLCVAPDGSLLVADWYDPGVGGHKVEDLAKGRIFRIAPQNGNYDIPEYDYSTPNGAIAALKSPNLATRYLAWTTLEEMGPAAESALTTMWQDSNPRYRARALWLLARLDDKTQDYIQKGLSQKNPNLRITALRIARQLDQEHLLDYVAQLIDDPNPQVRREAAIALRYEDSLQAAEIWTQLALQYDGKDRWYLEALGIGADLHADLFFDIWINEVSDAWKTDANKDIIWRMRSKAAIPMLATLIQEESDIVEMERYFRAMDFHSGQEREKALLAILKNDDHPQHEAIQAIALSHMRRDDFRKNPVVQQALITTLASMDDEADYLFLLEKYIGSLSKSKLAAQLPKLKALAMESEENDIRIPATELILQDRQGQSWIAELLKGYDLLVRKKIMQNLSLVQNQQSMKMLEAVISDTDASMTDRQAAIQALGNGWNGSHRLMDLLEAGKIDDPLVESAANRLMTAWDGNLRKAAMNYLPQVVGKQNPLPPINELVALEGNDQTGRQVFTQSCGICHQVNGEGINFGPDLSEIGNKLSREALYAAILHPSAGISFGYEGYLIKILDDNTYSGYIESENETVLTLRMPGGISQKIDKDNIASMEELPQSLMPEGLYQTMSEEELVDLVEYLTGLKRKEELALK